VQNMLDGIKIVLCCIWVDYSWGWRGRVKWHEERRVNEKYVMNRGTEKDREGKERKQDTK